MLQSLLDTTSLSGREWIIVLALSLLAPAVVAIDKVLQLRQQSKAQAGAGFAGPAIRASADSMNRISDRDPLRRRTPSKEGQYHG